MAEAISKVEPSPCESSAQKSPKCSATKSPKIAPQSEASAVSKKEANADAKRGKDEKDEKKPLKPATSSREDNLQYDLGLLAAYDISPQPTAMKELEFLAHTRDSVQLLVNKIFGLPRTTIEEGVVVKLPTDGGIFLLPRSKPVPKEKLQTRWQKFMEDKNMRKRKRSRLVFDEASGDWVPRWGYGSIRKREAAAKSAIYEFKDGEDTNSDPVERQRAEKKLQIARQKLREVRNQVEAAGGKMRAAVPDLDQRGTKRGKDGLREAIRRAQLSSGSRGKFDKLANNEPTNLNAKRQRPPSSMGGEGEKERNLKFAGKVLAGETFDKDKMAKVGNQQREGLKKKKQPKGVKGTPGKGRRSKQGGRTRGRKIKK